MTVNFFFVKKRLGLGLQPPKALYNAAELIFSTFNAQPCLPLTM